MKSSTVTPLVLLALLLSGCTYSVHPILPDSDLTADVNLSGTWALTPQDSDRHDLHSFSMQSVDGGTNYRGSLDDGKEFAARIGRPFAIVRKSIERKSVDGSVSVDRPSREPKWHPSQIYLCKMAA